MMESTGTGSARPTPGPADARPGQRERQKDYARQGARNLHG
ncbi:MAG TPA: hypothetical protein VF179_02860 [Thermoanaerobaculia bacterium]|nr:hypothetical protein [Thermoanaerobaculia bacterium]